MEGYPGCHWFASVSLYFALRLVQTTHTTFSTKVKLIASRSVRFPALLTVCFCFELSLANDDVNICAYWLLSLLWFRFFGTHLKTALKEKKRKMAINFHLLRKSRQYPSDLKSTYRS